MSERPWPPPATDTVLDATTKAAPSSDPMVHLFSAPFMVQQWDDVEEMNAELVQVVLAAKSRYPSARMSNVGGWQSEKILQELRVPAVQRLLSLIDIATFRMTAQCVGEEAISGLGRKWDVVLWANVNEYGDYNGLHNHTGGFWSGVYYVQPGSAAEGRPESGAISFRSPILARLCVENLRVPEDLRRAFPSSYTLQPRPGMMLMFPSWLEHQVLPYFGAEPRISMIWDVVFR